MIRTEQLQKTREKFAENPTATVIVNPHAGGKWNNRRLYIPGVNKVIKLMEDPDGLGFKKVIVVYTKSARHASDTLAQAIRDKNALVAIKGGDGTNAQLVYEAGDTAITLLGGGRQNVVTKALTREIDPFTIFVKSVIGGEPTKVDVGVVTTGESIYPFLANMDIGAGASVIDRWQRAGNRVRLAMWNHFQDEKKARNYPTFSLAFDGEEEKNVGEKALFIAQNFGPYGGHLSLQKSSMTDGQLEATVVDPMVLDNKEIVALFMREWITKKPHKYGLEKKQFSSAQVTVTNKELITFQTDGDVHKTGNTLTVGVSPNKATLWVPSGSLH